MKKSNIRLAVFLFTLGLMAFTNPSKEEYISWAKEKVVQRSSGFLEKGLVSLLGNTVLDTSTTKINLVFFSIFSTSVAGRDLQAVGIFNNFFPLPNLSSSNIATIPLPTSNSGSNSSSESSSNLITKTADPTPKSTSFPRTQQAGFVKVIGKHGTVDLPVIGVEVRYGLDLGRSPSIIPANKLPDVRFTIPEEYVGSLAVYWMNLGYTDDRGMTFLAPKDWIVISAGVGANGSVGLSLSSNPNQKNSEDLLYQNDGNCQGCAIDDIGTYFPKYLDWAKQNSTTEGKFINPPLDMKTTYFDDNTVGYSFRDATRPYETHGVAKADINKGQNHFEKLTINTLEKDLASAILNFYLNY